MPDEQEKFQAYGDIARQMTLEFVTIRTLDMGKDKPTQGGTLAMKISTDSLSSYCMRVITKQPRRAWIS